MRLLLVAILVLLGALGFLYAGSANAQQYAMPCYAYDSLLEVAKQKHGEIPLGTGAGLGGTLTMLLDPKDMSWGIITRAANGCSLYFGGDSFEFADKPKPAGKDS